MLTSNDNRSVFVEHIVIGVYPGANIGDVMKIAAKMSVDNECDIRFTFNGKWYRAIYKEIMEVLYRERG